MTVLARPRRADVRARILRAAAASFLEHGYADTTVADIATRAGFTKGAVYSNFGGKPELFSAVFAERTASVAGIAISQSGVREGSQPKHRTASAIAASLTRQVTEPSGWPSALAEFRALAARDETVRASYTQLRLRQRQQLEEQLRDQADVLGLPSTFDYAVAANLLLTLTHALATEFSAAPESTPAPLIEASLVSLLESLLP